MRSVDMIGTPDEASSKPEKKHFFYTEKWDSYWEEYKKVPNTTRIALVPTLIVFILVTIFSSFTIIPTGYTGVRSTFGQINSNTVSPGFNWKIPFVQSIERVNNKQQDVKLENQVWSETSERTAIYYENIIISYSINPDKSAWIFANINNYRDTLITKSVVSSAVKSASKNLTDVDATNRSIVEPQILQLLQESLDSKYDTPVVKIHKVTVGNIDFDESYNQAIAAKQQALINAQQAKIENDRAVEKAEADKKVKIAEAQAAAESAKTQAQADAEVKKINAEANAEVKKVNAKAEADALSVTAKAQAQANKDIAQSLTPELVKKMYYDKWDGNLPNVMTNDSSGILMQVGD